jgi:hypothetical protein
LSGINLGNANLSGANLRGARLISAELSGANLSHTNLSGANISDRTTLIDTHLVGADLSYTSLNEAILTGADLSNAILNGADLTGADLSYANLSGAALIDADLTGVHLAETILANLDLTGAVGLKACRHHGPSVIDHRTLEKANELPIEFLRGIGLPEKLIDYLPSIAEQAIQYYSCFISYSTKDQSFADRIHAGLQDKGIRCWFAPHDMPIGGKLLDEINAAIRLRDKLLLILSRNSIESSWVEDEVSMAFEEERRRGQTVLFPIRLDDAVMDTKEAWAGKLRRDRNIGDFRHWEDHDTYGKSFERMVRDLAAKPTRLS